MCNEDEAAGTGVGFTGRLLPVEKTVETGAAPTRADWTDQAGPPSAG